MVDTFEMITLYILLLMFIEFDHIFLFVKFLGKGYITLEDVKNIWKKVLPKVSWNAIRDAFYEACCFDENDQMSYLQFRHFLFNL